MNSNNQEFMKRVKEVYDTQNIQGFLDFISNEEEKNKLLEAIDKAYENFPKTNLSYTTEELIRKNQILKDIQAKNYPIQDQINGMNVEATLSGQGLTDEKTNLLLQNYKLPSIKDKRNINKTEIGNNNVENKDKKQPK